MGLKVLELNASSTRSGRQVLANLREATQSHSVKKQEKMANGDERSISFNSKIENAKNGLPIEKKSIDKTTVILFEDIDIVFEELDEGFHSAINNLIATTKRPIVLTTSSQNFMACSTNKILNLKFLPQIFEFRPVQPPTIAKYLQLLCLVEGFNIDYDSILGLVSHNKGNVSASMHQLQYYVSLYGSSGHIVPYNYLNNSFKKSELTAQPKKSNCPDIDCRPVEKEDSLAKLMSLNLKNEDLRMTTNSLLNCTLSLIGLELDNTMIDSPSNSNCYQGQTLLNDFNVMKKLLAVRLFDIFDWSRHILLPFRRIVHSNVRARSTTYPLTAKTNIRDSTLPSKTPQFTDVTKTKESRKSYKRILNSNSLFMTESEEDKSTSDESGELIENRNCGGVTNVNKDDSQQQINDDCVATTKINSITKSYIAINDLSNDIQSAQVQTKNKKDKRLSNKNAKRALEILSDYTDCMSNFMPLQDEIPFWLSYNHKVSSCSSQLCANSNFYDSYMTPNNFELADTYSSNRKNSDFQERILAQDIIANVIHSTLRSAQNSINLLLPEETSLFELSVHRPPMPSTEELVAEEALAEVKEVQPSDDLCAGHINEMTKTKVKLKIT